MNVETKPIHRRDFLKTALVALGSVVTLEIGGLALAYMQPRLAVGDFGSLIVAGKVNDFPPGSVTHISNGRFYLARLPDGGFLALYQRCTHLGCSVPWDQTEQQFICPCHSSKFTIEGEVQNPPAPRPLDRFAVLIDGDAIRVDTSAPLPRQGFDPSQVVYP